MNKITIDEFLQEYLDDPLLEIDTTDPKYKLEELW